MKEIFVTIVGIKNYYDSTPFKVGGLIKLAKEPENHYDAEAIRAELPFIGTIGYVANSHNTVYQGTFSAGRLYDKMGDSVCAQVMFITKSAVIAKIEYDKNPFGEVIIF